MEFFPVYFLYLFLEEEVLIRLVDGKALFPSGQGCCVVTGSLLTGHPSSALYMWLGEEEPSTQGFPFSFLYDYYLNMLPIAVIWVECGDEGRANGLPIWSKKKKYSFKKFNRGGISTQMAALDFMEFMYVCFPARG